MAANITITRKARGTGSYRITSPNGLTVLLEVTPTKVVINGLEIGNTGISSNLIPTVDGAFDLGSEFKSWGTAFLGGMVNNTFRGFSGANTPAYGGGIDLQPAAGADTSISCLPATGSVTMSAGGSADPVINLRARDNGKLRLQSGGSATLLAIEGSGSPGIQALALEFTAPARATPVVAPAQAGLITFNLLDTSIDVQCSRLNSQGAVLATIQSLDATMKSVVAKVTGPGTFTLTANAAPTTAAAKVAFLVINPAS